MVQPSSSSSVSSKAESGPFTGDVGIVGYGQTTYYKKTDRTLINLLADAARKALDSSGLDKSDIDGISVCSFVLPPDNAVTLAEQYGLSVGWAYYGTAGGAGPVAAVLNAVRRLEAVMVWDINAEKAESLAAALRAAGFNAARADDLASAVGAADIVTCATLSRAPLVLREWLKPGTHLDLIGSFQPSMRETDDAVFADTSVFIDTTEALEKSGDILSPIENGVFRADQVLATLEDLCRGKHSGRKRDDEITVYKAVGTASEDLAAAMLVYGDRQP